LQENKRNTQKSVRQPRAPGNPPFGSLSLCYCYTLSLSLSLSLSLFFFFTLQPAEGQMPSFLKVEKVVES
jgi:hypothetical protein